MPEPLPWSGARVPISDEGDDVPADMLRYASDINPLLVLQADDQADRDANFSTVPDGTVVSCAALSILWQKISGGWKTYGYQTSWAAPGVTWNSGWTDSGSFLRREGNMLVGVITAAYNVDIGAFTASGDTAGNLTDLLVCTLPTDMRPPYNWPVPMKSAFGSGMGWVVAAAGTLYLTDGPPGAKIIASQNVYFPINYPVT